MNEPEAVGRGHSTKDLVSMFGRGLCPGAQWKPLLFCEWTVTFVL